MIDEYTFGRISVNGKVYEKDIIIYPDGQVQDSWWRESGHKLCIDDIHDLIETDLEMIIAGTGSPGLMKAEEELIELLTKKGILFKALPSEEAMQLYNNLYMEKRIGACFHLTC